MTAKDKVLERMNNSEVVILRKQIRDMKWEIKMIEDDRVSLRKELKDKTKYHDIRSKLIVDLENRLVEEESLVRSLTEENEELKISMKKEIGMGYDNQKR